MYKKKVKAISLKALVDKENQRVIHAESDADLIDVLFSLFTMPMGTIIRLLSNHSQQPTVGIGCMKNLYESIKDLDMLFFWSEACKSMLLCPRNGYASWNKRLKLQIDDGELPMYFLCNSECTLYGHKLLGLYPNTVCKCGGLMDRIIELSDLDFYDGVFVRGLAQFIISDELQVKPKPSLETIFSLGCLDCSTIEIHKLDMDGSTMEMHNFDIDGSTIEMHNFDIDDSTVDTHNFDMDGSTIEIHNFDMDGSTIEMHNFDMDGSAIETHNFDIGVDDVITLLRYSLVSKKPLTETLLKQYSAPMFGKKDFDLNIYVESKLREPKSNVDGKIHGKEDFEQYIYVQSQVEEPELNVDGKIHDKEDFEDYIYAESQLEEPELNVDGKIHGKENFERDIYVESKVEEPELNVDGKIHGKEDFDQNIYGESKVEEPESNVDGKIRVKLIVSKSKNIVCYAEASEEFVDLVFSFLTVPLGYIIKETQSSISIGSLTHLYNSVQKLDAEKYFKSNEHKDMLINPKLAPYFSYENHLLGIDETLHPTYCYAEEYGYFSCQSRLTSDGKIPSGSLRRSSITPFGSGWRSSILTLKDPRSHFEEAPRGGFVRGPTMFTVTDNLIVTPISQISSVFLLKKLKLPFSDIEERVVNVGSEEASRLLVASFVSESALTNVFLGEPNPGF